jgi:ABC-2 type transport system ATP-binding protein
MLVQGLRRHVVTEPMISLKDLRKSFGPVEALRGVSIEIPAGGTVGLLGPNGAGKSTLIRILLGLLKPSSGAVRVLGIDSTTHPLDIRSRVGYMPEDDCHIPGLSAVGYVAYAAELSGLPPADAIRRAHEVLDYVGMDEERYRQVETYSSGMRQRIKLAQAIVHDPVVLFLDEPTDGMDPGGRDDMLELIRDIASLGDVSILVSSHLLHDVEEVCSHIVVLGMGTVRLVGDLATLRLAGENRFEVRLKGDTTGFLKFLAEIGGEAHPAEGEMLRVSLPAGETAKRIVELAHRTHVQIRHLRPALNTLEDVFMHAMREEENEHDVTEKGASHAHP